MQFSGEELAIVSGVFFFAAFVKGITGLGFSTTCLPFLVLALGLKATLPLLIIPSLASNAIVMRDAGHFRETLRRFWPLFLAALPGVAIGLWLLDTVDARVSAAVLGVVLVGYCLFALANPHLALPQALQRPLAPVAGLLTGLINGVTGSQVMPVLPYLLSLKLDPNRFVQAINCSFSLSSIVMAIGLSRLGLMTLEVAALSMAGLVFVYAGVTLGNRARRALKPNQFRIAVLVMLMAFGGSLVFRWLFAM